MKLRLSLLAHALAALGLAWLYGGDTLDALRAQSAEVSAYLEPPNLVFALGALLATGLGAGATALGVAQQRPSAWRGFRVLPIAAVVVLFVDLFVFSAAKSPLDSSELTALAIQNLAEAASSASSEAAVTTSPRELQQLVAQLGPPAYLVNGERAKGWTLSLRSGCAGPVTQVNGEPLGTLFYCVAPDSHQAWVTAVTLPVGTYFGAPQLFTRSSEPVVAVVNVKLADAPDPTPGGSPSADAPGPTTVGEPYRPLGPVERPLEPTAAAAPPVGETADAGR